MRIDGKAEGLRQSMSWLHTWSGLLLGWLLFAIFFTGTLSFFHNELTTWMKPETHQSLTTGSREEQLLVALNTLQEKAPNASAWTIGLPEARQTVTSVNVRQPWEDPRERRGGERWSLDSVTGEVIESRETRGGGFLYRFHFELYAMPRTWARWLVGIATFAMFIALISGIIIHKKIFKDFFTFRPGKGQRSWLDAHNATAVLGLPFHLMITFSGLLLLMFTIFPWGATETFSDRQAFLQAQNGMVVNRTQGSSREGASRQREMSRERMPEGSRGASRAPNGMSSSRDRHPLQPQKEAATMVDMLALWRDASERFPQHELTQITITHPNTVDAKVDIRSSISDSLINRRHTPSVSYSGVTGDIVNAPVSDWEPSTPAAIYNWIVGLHMARGVDLGLRWMMFLSGLLGTLMVASGLVLWVVKRLPEQAKRGRKTFGFRVIEMTNVAAMSGLLIATAVYFLANRFIPAAADGRADQEILSFFVAWAVAFIHAVVRPHRQAWLEQLGLATVLFVSLPLINAITGGRGLWSALVNEQWVVASVDLMSLVLAGSCAWAFYVLRRSPLMVVARHSGNDKPSTSVSSEVTA